MAKNKPLPEKLLEDQLQMFFKHVLGPAVEQTFVPNSLNTVESEFQKEQAFIRQEYKEYQERFISGIRILEEEYQVLKKRKGG